MQNAFKSLNRQEMPQSKNKNHLNCSFGKTRACTAEEYEEIERNLEHLFRNTDDCNKNDNNTQKIHVTAYNSYETENSKHEEIHVNGDLDENKLNEIVHRIINNYSDNRDARGKKRKLTYNNWSKSYNVKNVSISTEKKVSKKTTHNCAENYKRTFWDFDNNGNNSKNVKKSPIVEACINGNLTEVRKLISNNVENGDNLILLASVYGHYDLVKEFLKLGINADSRGKKNDTTSLMEAASAGYLNIVKLLVKNGANVNAKSKSKNTPLIFASASAHKEIVEYLITQGALIDSCNDVGFNALLEAISLDHPEIVKILIRNGANINYCLPDTNETALSMACYNRDYNLVNLLLRFGAGRTELPNLIEDIALTTLFNDHTGDFLNAPLTLAARNGHLDLALLLIERGVNKEQINFASNYTALMEACREGYHEMVVLLLSQGVEVNVVSTQTHETALTIASSLGYILIANSLLQAGADIELGLKSPLILAVSNGELEMVQFLLDSGANLHKKPITHDTALGYACKLGYDKIANLLLYYGADPNQVSEDGRTPLMKACYAGHLGIVKSLVKYKANVNKESVNNDHTPLSLACSAGHFEIVEFLLLAEADPYHRIKDNSTMIIEAAKGGYTDIVKMLIDYPRSIIRDDTENVDNLISTQHQTIMHSHNNQNEHEHHQPTYYYKFLPNHNYRNDSINGDIDINDDNNNDYNSNNDINQIIDQIDYLTTIEENSDLLKSLGIIEDDQADTTNILNTVPSSDLLHMSQYEENTLSKLSLSDLTTSVANEHSNLSETDFRFNKLSEISEDDINVATALEIIEKDEPLNRDFESKLICDNIDSKLKSEENRQKLKILEEIKKAERNFTNFMIQAYSDGTSTTSYTLDISNLINNNGVSVNTVTAKTVTTTTTSTAIIPAHVMPVSSTSVTLIEKESKQKNEKLNSLEVDKCKTIPTNKKYSSGRKNVIQKATDYLLCLAEKNDPVFQEFLQIDSECNSSNKSFGEILQTLEEISFDDTTDLFKGLMEAFDLEEDDDDDYVDYDDDNNDVVEKEIKLENSTKEIAKFNENVTIDLDITQVDDDGINHIDINEALLRSEFGNYSIIGIINRNDNNNVINSVNNDNDNDNNKKIVNSNEVIGKHEKNEKNIYENFDYLFDTDDDSSSDNCHNKNNQNEEFDVFCLDNFEKNSIAFRQKCLGQEQCKLSDIHLKATITPDKNPSQIYKKLPNRFSNYEERKCMSIDELAEKCFKDKLIEAQELKKDRNRKKTKNFSKFQEKMKKNQKKQSRSILNQTKNIEKNSIKKDDPFLVNKNCGKNINNSSVEVKRIENKLTKRNLFNETESFQTSVTSVYVDNVTDKNNDTALTIAASNGYFDLVELLLSRGANIEHCDKKGFTSLIHAAVRGFEQIVDFLLEKGADIEVQSERTKDTPLSLACSNGKYNVAELLLMRGANKEHRNVSDYTPLSLAASNGYLNIIQLLLNHGAEINSRTGSKLCITPLMLAAMNGHTDAVRLLIDYGGDVNGQIETNKNTALTLACFQGRSKVVSVLLNSKAHIEHRAKTGLTPLMEAASGGFVEVGKILIAKKADVNAPPVPSSRDTALTIAADKGHLDFVKLLVTNGAIIDVKNKKGNTPLWLAANSGHLQVAEYLYKNGANIDSQDNRKISCLMTAFRKGHLNIVCWMVNLVSQLPNECELTKYLSSIVINIDNFTRSSECLEIIATAKHARIVKANEHAANLLKEISMERNRDDSRRGVNNGGSVGGSGGCGGNNSNSNGINNTGSGNINKKRDKKKKDKKRKEITDKKRQDIHDDSTDNNSKLEKNSSKSEFIKHDIYSKSLLPIYSVKSKRFEQSDITELCNNATDNLYEQDKNNSKIISNSISKKDCIQRVNESIDDDFEANKLNNSVNINRINNKKNINDNNNDNTTDAKKVKKKKNLISSTIIKNNLDDLNVRKCGKNSIVNTDTNQNTKPNDYQNKKSKSERKLNKLEKKSIELNDNISKDVKEIKSSKEVTNQNKDSKTTISVTSVSTSNVLALPSENNKHNRYELSTPDLNVNPISKLELSDSSDLSQSVPSNTAISPNSSDLNLNNSGCDNDTNGWKKVGKRAVVKKGMKKIFVPLQVIPRIIGKAGKNINLIRSTSGAQIEIEKQRKNQSQRTITLKGSIDATKRAYFMLDALIHDSKIDVAVLVKKFSVDVPIDDLNIEASIAFNNEIINIPITTGFNYDYNSDRNSTTYSKTRSNAVINVSLSQSNCINANNKSHINTNSTNSNLWNTVQKIDSRSKQSTLLSTVTTTLNLCNQTTSTKTNYLYTTALKSNNFNYSTQLNNTNDSRMQFSKSFDDKTITSTTSNTIVSNNVIQSNINVSTSEYNQKIPFSAILNANKSNYSTNEYKSNQVLELNTNNNNNNNKNNNNIDTNVRQLSSPTLSSYVDIQNSLNLNTHNLSTSKSQSATTSTLVTSSNVNYIPEYSLFYNSFPSIDKVSYLSRQNDPENQLNFKTISSNNIKSNICDKSNSISKLLESSLIMDSIDDNIDISKAPGYRKDNCLFSKTKYQSGSASIASITAIATTTSLTSTSTLITQKNKCLSSLQSQPTSSLPSSLLTAITTQISLPLTKSSVSISTPLSSSNHSISCVNNKQSKLNNNYNISSYSSHSLSNSFSSGLCSSNSDKKNNLTSSLSLNCINDSVYSTLPKQFKDYENDKHLSNMISSSRLNPSAPDFLSTLYSKKDQNYQYLHQNLNQNKHNSQFPKESQESQEEKFQKEQKQYIEQKEIVVDEQLSSQQQQQQQQFNQSQSQFEEKYQHQKESLSQQNVLNCKNLSIDALESILSNTDHLECFRQKLKEYQAQEQLKYFTQQLQINNNNNNTNSSAVTNNVNYLTNYDYFLNSQEYKDKLNSLSLAQCKNNTQNHNANLLTNLNQNPIGIERTWKKFNENCQIALDQQNIMANTTSTNHNHMSLIPIPSSVAVSNDNLQYVDYCDSNFDGHFESWPSKYNNPFWNNIPPEEMTSTHNLMTTAAMNTIPTAAVMLPSTINSTGSTVTSTANAFYKNPNIMTYALQMNPLNTSLNTIGTFDENNFIDNYMQSNNLLNHCNSQQLSFMQSTPFQLVSPYYNLNNQVIDQYYQYTTDMNNSNIVDVAGITSAVTVANAAVSSAPVSIISPNITFE